MFYCASSAVPKPRRVTSRKALRADYVLVFRNHKLALIEAKAWDESLTEGVAQVKNYADKIETRFAYSTNGREIYGIDMENGSEDVAGRYPTPEELWNQRLQSATLGETASQACHLRTKVATFKDATIRT